MADLNTDTADYLSLKWGTLKAWSFHGEDALALLREYAELGMSLGAAQQRDSERQKDIICELIDAGNFETVYLDWDDKDVSKEDAKAYVLGYGETAVGNHAKD